GPLRSGPVPPLGRARFAPAAGRDHHPQHGTGPGVPGAVMAIASDAPRPTDHLPAGPFITDQVEPRAVGGGARDWASVPERVPPCSSHRPPRRAIDPLPGGNISRSEPL